MNSEVEVFANICRGQRPRPIDLLAKPSRSLPAADVTARPKISTKRAHTRRSQRREYWAIVYGKKCLGSILSPERRSLSPFLPSRPQSRQVARPDKTMIEIARLTGMKVGRHSPEERKTRPCRSQAISDRGTCLQLFSLFLKEKEEKGRQVERKLRYEPTMFQIVFCRLVN